MANQTLIPALRAKVGDWEYYICSMKYGVVDSQIKFAYELGGNTALNTMIQRGLSNRTQEITEYLVRSEHRFLGAMIVACWGGAPKYIEVQMEDPEGYVSSLDEGFGILTFDGSQRFFALDGQHRLRAIKDALNKDASLANEDICVLIVSHFETDEGRERTRRLFTNINRNAKMTSAAENIALDEDDGYAILTRRLLQDHDWLKNDGVVKVFTKIDAITGEIKLAGDAITKTDAKAASTITVVYKMLMDLGLMLDHKIDLHERPSDDQLETAYDLLSGYIDDLLDKCGNYRKQAEAAASMRDLRAPKNKEETGHPFARPVVQRAVARVASHIVDQERLTWAEVCDRLSKLTWSLDSAPWTAVYDKKMLAGSTFTDLLEQLLYAHLAPASAKSITDARKAYKDIRGKAYPVSEADLKANLVEAKGAATTAGDA
jgi:DNA sulfur modification protein DndB